MNTPEKLQVTDKFSKKPIGMIATADRELVDRAINATHKAFESTDWSPYQRYTVLKKVSELLLENKEDLAQTITKEVGKPWKQALVEVERTAQTFEISAEEAKRMIRSWGIVEEDMEDYTHLSESIEALIN